MTQDERDRLVVLRKANKGLITQKQAAAELRVGERQVRRLVAKLRDVGDRAAVHGLRGRASNRKLAPAVQDKAIRILRQDIYRGFGPTLASEYLAAKHQIAVNRETVRQWMSAAGLWTPRPRRVSEMHVWRPRRACAGELVQWDSSDHRWLENRGPGLYLVSMIDDATSRLFARFVERDTSEAHMRVLWAYLERYGRPVSFYTDKAGMFQVTAKTKRQQDREGRDPPELPPTQIGRALGELGIELITAHSPQAKGRIERSFATAQDRLVKGLRVARARTLAQANDYLEQEFLPWWNRTCTVAARNPTDAHRKLDRAQQLAAILCHVEQRQVTRDYTFQFRRQRYQIARHCVWPGLRGSHVRIELRLDGALCVRFQDHYLEIAVCRSEPPTETTVATQPAAAPPKPKTKSKWMQGFLQKPAPPLWKAMQS